MVNKDFCLSSYIAFRYIWKDGVDFAEGFRHGNFLPVPDSDRIPVRSAEEIDREIRRQFDALYAKYDRICIPAATPTLSPPPEARSLTKTWNGRPTTAGNGGCSTI